VPYSFISLGMQSLKNIDRPIQAYRLARDDAARLPVRAVDLPLPDKPSIVVLPFVNMSAGPDETYFVDGLTEDLITDLSKVPSLFVIARNSSFAYKGTATDVRQIARDLGVKYVLEGSARRAAGRVRINAQLIDAIGGGHIWADRFDRDVADIFAAQDEAIGKIVEALVGKLTATSLRARYRPASLEAYDLCVRGRLLWGQSPIEVTAVRPLFERAIELDPNYSEAHRWLALAHWSAWTQWGEPTDPHRPLAVSLARRAVELGPEDSGARWALGFVLLYEREWEQATREFDVSFRLNPNDADAWAMSSDFRVFEGRGAAGIECVAKALRLNPHPPGWYYWVWDSPNMPPASMRPRSKACARRRHIAPALDASWRRPLLSSVGLMRPWRKRDCISPATPTSPSGIGWKPSHFATWPCGTGSSKGTARPACRSDGYRRFWHDDGCQGTPSRNPMMTDSFSDDYAEARGKFVAAARDAKARIHSYGRDDLRGKGGEPLACDVAVLGPDDAERAAIVITGTHGIEGYCGAAVLHRWLTSQPGNADIDGIKIVLVHALNSWGFSHKTRTTREECGPEQELPLRRRHL